MTSRDESEACEHFRARYAVPATDVINNIEASVIGAAWGANGYTTLDQADELARRLAFQLGRRAHRVHHDLRDTRAPTGRSPACPPRRTPRCRLIRHPRATAPICGVRRHRGSRHHSGVSRHDTSLDRAATTSCPRACCAPTAGRFRAASARPWCTARRDRGGTAAPWTVLRDAPLSAIGVDDA